MSMTKPELLKYLGNFLGEELNRSSDEWQDSDHKNPYWDAYLLSRSLEFVNTQIAGENDGREHDS